MSANPPSRKKALLTDRRAPPGAKGDALRQLKGMLSRPLTLEKRNGQLHITFVERRRSDAPARLPQLSQLRSELRVRLLAHEHEDAARLMRHLVYVHDLLGRKGWTGVEELPAPVLAKALVQAEMLVQAAGQAREDPSPALDLFIEHLREVKLAAEKRRARKADQDSEDLSGRPEVSEATHEEFDLMERSWVGTMPGDLVAP